MKVRLFSCMLVTVWLATFMNANEYESQIKDIGTLTVLDSFYPPIDQQTHLWLSMSLLVFKPKEKSIVLTNKPTDLFTVADVTLQPNVKADFNWDVGSRIGFGYIFTNCKWDMAINWTRFTSHLKQCRSTQGDISLGMFPIWSLADDIIQYDWVSTARMKWKLKLNLVDLDFGRTFSCVDTFFLRIPIGLRAAVINQNLNVHYGGGIFANGLNLTALDSTFGYDRITMKNNFWAIGPRVGIEPQVNLGKGLRLYASTCGTIAGGFFHVHQKETYLKTVRFDRKCCPGKFRWILDATAGFLWKTFICDDLYALTFGFGWEYHGFFDMIEFKGDKFGLVSSDRDLSLNGFAFSFYFDF